MEGGVGCCHFPLAQRLSLLIGVTALFYAPILLGVRTFPDGDFTHHFLPFSLFQQSSLLVARLPVWNPFTYGGHPFLADVQAAVFYPVSNLLLLVTLPFTSPGARLYILELEAIGQVALAGFFVYLLVRDLAENRWAGFLAGLLFALSGYLTGYPPVQLAVLRTAIWLPFILWTLLHAVTTPGRWRWWVATAGGLAIAFLAGHSQTFLYTIYTTIAWATFLLVRIGMNPANLGRGSRLVQVLLGLLAVLLVSIGLSAAQLLPSLEFAGLSVRANVDYAYVSGGFPLQDTWQMLLPSVLTTYSPLYIGVIGLGLVVLSWGELARYRLSLPTGKTVGGLVSRRAGILFFTTLAAIALALAYGANGFLYPIFYRFVPGWDLFRGQERAAYLVALGLCILAGYGTAAVTRLPQRRRSWLATLFAGLVIAGAYLFGLLWQLPGRTVIGQWHYLWIALATMVLAALFAVIMRLPGWSERRMLLLTLLATINLFFANAGTNIDTYSPARKVILSPEVEAVQVALAETVGTNVGLVGRTYNESRIYEDFGMRAGAEDVWGASPLRLARYDRLFDQFPLDRMWRLLGVDHVLTWRRELFEPSQILGEFPQTTDTTYLHRLDEPNPRAWLAPAVQIVDDEEAVQLLADHGFDLDAVGLLPVSGSNDDWAGSEPVVAAGTPASITLQQLAPAELRIALDSPTAGLLLVGENWMPGWRVEHVTCASSQACEKDMWPATGLPYLQAIRANLSLVGVPVPAGAITFDLVYRPDSVRFGLWISGATLLLLLAVSTVRVYNQRRRKDRA